MGPQGIQGIQGPAGTSGPFASISNDNATTIAVLLGGTNVPFPDAQLLSGVTVDGSNTVLTVTAAGAYRVHYCLRLQTALLTSSTVVINGISALQLLITPTTPRDTFCRTAILNLAAGDTLSVQLLGMLGAAQLIPGGGDFIVEQVGTQPPG
jgi:hypothetical protein